MWPDRVSNPGTSGSCQPRVQKEQSEPSILGLGRMRCKARTWIFFSSKKRFCLEF